MVFVLKMSISEFIDWYQWALCGHTMNCLPLPLELCASIHWFWLPLRYNSSGQSKFAHVDVIEWVPELVRLNPQISRCENLLTACVSMFLCEINAKRIGKCIAEHEQTHTKKRWQTISWYGNSTLQRIKDSVCDIHSHILTAVRVYGS